jgi:ParB family chromosome partitioning protein
MGAPDAPEDQLMAGGQAFDAQRGTIFRFNPETLIIVDDPTDPLFDPRGLEGPNEALVRSIMLQGVIHPIVVCKRGDMAIVVAGRRRTLAAREANKRLAAEGRQPITVPASQRRGGEASLLGALIAENEIREAADPLRRAAMASELINLGTSIVDTAIVFGVTVDTVRNWLDADEATEAVKGAVRSGAIGLASAADLAKLPREKQADVVGKIASEAAGKPRKPGAKRPQVSRRRVQEVASGGGGSDGGGLTPDDLAEITVRSEEEILKRWSIASLPAQYRKALLWVLGGPA